LKAAYRGLELALQAWEAARCAIGGGPVDDEPWERLCFAQFHDALPGTSITLVFAELTPELERLAATCRARAVADLGGTGPLPFNTLPFPRLVHHAGKVWQLPALSTGTMVEPRPTITTATTLDNGLLCASFTGGDVAAIDGTPVAGGCFTLAEDHPANYDAWEIDRQSLRLAQRVGPTELAVVAPGRLRGTCAIGDNSTLTVDYVLLPGERHLRVEARVDWRDQHRLLRYALDTRCAGAMARFGCPFGSILRPQQPSSPQVEAMWEVPGSRWAAAVRDDGTGVALLTASNWGFSCRDGHLGVSLLRGPTYPDAQTDQGEQVLRFAIGAYAPAFAGDALPTAAAADALYAEPLLVARATTTDVPVPVGSLVPAWACPTADGWELRLHEVAGSAGADHGPYAIVTRQLSTNR
jgi:alpha-mannosidase